MGREERVMRLLEVLVESGCAMPAVVVFRNAKLQGADFERRVADSYLKELQDRGLVIKVDAGGLEDGDVVEIDPSQEGWFIATEEGHEFISED